MRYNSPVALTSGVCTRKKLPIRTECDGCDVAQSGVPGCFEEVLSIGSVPGVCTAERFEDIWVHSAWCTAGRNESVGRRQASRLAEQFNRESSRPVGIS